ncbi:MAG: phage holin family protein [Methylotenera sp.]|uniref:phage holin family protein n=1 Tax=Methylotenera sp. TaxID=2051956 RepID=UPI0024883B2F|nr:phage holin family protein [Methylotenera sp.]MDI1308062.1 phage holin family protein [Methylotenera sp.]
MENKTSTNSTIRSQGLFQSIKALTSTLVSIAHNRLELLSTDLEEAKEQLIRMLVLALVSLFSIFIAAVLITITIVIAFWDTHRMLALFSATGFFIIVAIATCITIIREAKKAPKMFLASLIELIKDRTHFDQH